MSDTFKAGDIVRVNALGAKIAKEGSIVEVIEVPTWASKHGSYTHARLLFGDLANPRDSADHLIFITQELERIQ
jgi:2-iminoacetate synthase ThiH